MVLSLCIRHGFAGFTLDAAFEAGAGVTALFGPSGAGKTSIINAVAGLLTPKEGRISLDDEVLFDRAAGIDIPARRRGVGYVFQEARLFPHMTVRRNLLYGWKRSGRKASEAEIGRIVALLGIGALLERRPAALSGGERQRVGIGRALLSRPRLLLLDEPLASLDYQRRDEILPYLERLRDDGIPMLYVSHSIGDVARLSDRVLMVESGRIVAEGAPDDLFSRLDLLPDDGEAASVFQAIVDRHDAEYGLTSLKVPEGRLCVPLADLPAGSAVRLRVRAADVTLALEEPRSLSANNILHVTVSDIRHEGRAYADVQLQAGDHRFLARITRLSADRLGLAPGLMLYAIIKSVQIVR